ncbi:hypothetical protein [Massilia sp. TSP1-1-2]|uniref:hypothetical protein n=1 Tax=Massilia sp. TSP1-1-2 TaxID=2804649 RepID=UPI003CF5D84D
MITAFIRRLALLAALASLGACTTALLPPAVAPLVAPSASVAQASRRLDEVARERAAAESVFAASEQLCYAKFFVNNCLDAVKEKRRSRLAVLRAIEVEAERYKRQAAVDQRDRDVAQSVKEFEQGEARMAAQPASAPRVAPERTAPAPRAMLKDRSAEHAAKQAERVAQQQAEAPQRAANARAFEERRLKAEQRKREIEAKLAEKAAKAAAAAK